MRSHPPRGLAVLLASALLVPEVGFAQQAPPSSSEPAAEAPAPPPPVPTGADLSGSWVGWATLTNDWPGLSCRYPGSPDTPSVHVELTNDGGRAHGSVAIDLAAEQGSGCPPLRKRYAIDEVSTGPGTAAFTDSGGHEWTFSVRRAGAVLHGLVAWREGGPEQPLAEGFARPDGVRPMTRLSGEVRLQRTPAAGEPAAPAGAAARPPAKSGGGHKAGVVAAIIGVNAIGLGLLYGVNKLGKGNSGQGNVTCSARYCIVGAPNAPCFCENETITSGASCGLTTSGVPPGGACDNLKPGNPCQAGYSCNTTGGNGVCEDRFGRCVF